MTIKEIGKIRKQIISLKEDNLSIFAISEKLNISVEQIKKIELGEYPVGYKALEDFETLGFSLKESISLFCKQYNRTEDKDET